jgi:hypothetical protein
MVQQRRIDRDQLRPQPIETTCETTAKNAGAKLVAGPTFGLVRLAVAAGFEPAEGCPSRAFEARSLGRSDTPPPERLPNVMRVRESETNAGFTIARLRGVWRG